jgi:hypothetical protein
MKGTSWTQKEIDLAKKMRDSGMNSVQIGAKINRSFRAVKSMLRRKNEEGKFKKQTSQKVFERTCLCCSKPFLSLDPKRIRICVNCKSSEIFGGIYAK